MRYLACLGMLLLIGCDGLPLRFPNDTTITVRMDDHGRRFPTLLKLEDIPPNQTFGSRHCWKDSDAFFLATKNHPDPIVFDPKDFCEPRHCDCEIPVSRLIKRMTPAFVLRHQQDVCSGGGPFLQPDVRTQLCTAYVARTLGVKTAPLPWETDAAMLGP